MDVALAHLRQAGYPVREQDVVRLRSSRPRSW
ncbi:MAG: hypothetical protein M3O95_00210 [Candidatus Dormibacteraeota bacterium]|nr:hypothetical protein [Candidatus Dormibacteraeota bacterium]